MDTRYDLASLTKVVGTFSAIMHFCDDRKFDIEDPVSKFIPEHGNNIKPNTTIKNLLLHNAELLLHYPGTPPVTSE
jgi:CubicO group peptidase (beta-lactamase class C family)